MVALESGGTVTEERQESPGALRATTITTAAPTVFDFAGTVYSHGWAVLDPNRWDGERLTLTRTERLGPGRVVHLAVTGTGTADRQRVRIQATHDGELQEGERSAVRRSIRRMLRLDEDLAPFQSQCRRAGARWEPASRGLGRLLRSPSVFEDAVKTICTTNVQWGGTRAMLRGLAQRLGEPGPLSGTGLDALPNSFPTPEAVAASDGETLEAARLGYRAPYVRELAERVTTGDLDLEAFLTRDASTDEIRRSLLEIKGVGPYAAATLLMLLGRYDHLAVDSVYRSFVSRRYFQGRLPSDGDAERVYADWGRWKYLGYWFDLWKGLDEEV
jgi:3-methyladenine DNA glycosylase/8-oxoguanine DNA glycosylase